MSQPTPSAAAGQPAPASRPPFLIRPAGASDLIHFGSRLPEALMVTPLAKLLVAADASTFDIAGVASLRVFADQVGRFQIHVDPIFRRRGCGTALLDAVRETAVRAGVRSLMTAQSFEVAVCDEVASTARAFLQSRGLEAAQEIRRCRFELKTAATVLEPLYQRFMRRTANAQAAIFVPISRVDPNALAAFVVRHVGGLPETVARRLQGIGNRPFSPVHSLVAMVDNQIAGVLLGVPQDHNLIETRVVDEKYRGGGLNLALMYRASVAALARGIETIDFEHDTKEADTAKLVTRLGAVQVGCRHTGWPTGVGGG